MNNNNPARKAKIEITLDNGTIETYDINVKNMSWSMTVEPMPVYYMTSYAPVRYEHSGFQEIEFNITGWLGPKPLDAWAVGWRKYYDNALAVKEPGLKSLIFDGCDCCECLDGKDVVAEDTIEDVIDWDLCDPWWD